MSKNILLILIILCFNFSFAQKNELGKVTVEELKEKRHLIDTTAVAAVLFDKGKVSFEYSTSEHRFYMIREVKSKIKIYKKEGFDYANVVVQYLNSKNIKESVTFSNAITYNLIDGKIEKNKLKSDGEFDENINKNLFQKKIVLPNVKEGSVIEFKYIIRSNNIWNPRDWIFQKNVPVNYSEYKLIVPEYLVYNLSQKGAFVPKKTIENIRNTLTATNIIDKSLQSGMSVKQEKISQDFEYNETITTYIIENFNAVRQEPFVSNIENYTPGIQHELSMFKYPNQMMEKISTNWESVVKTVFEDSNFGTELAKNNYFESQLEDVIKGIVIPKDKIAAIFNFVKTNLKWNGRFGIFCDKGLKKAYFEKNGNVAEINLILTSMLKYAGFDANPILISTRSNGIAFYPSITAFNYVLSSVNLSGEILLLDATEINSDINILPLRDLNWLGRLVKADGSSEEVDLMPKKISNDAVTMNYSIDSKGIITGKLRRQLTDYNALAFRNKVEDVKEDIYLENLENEYEKIEIKDYSRSNDKNLKLPVTETFSFTSSNLTEIINSKIYINPMLFYTLHENPFKLEIREYPIDYGFSFLNKYVVNIQIPDGYELENLPTSEIFSMQDDIGSFKFITSSSANTINLLIMNQINTPIVSSEYYDMLKEFYQKMIDKQNEKIVLVKI